MRLRPFLLLSICLLGACDEKEMATRSTPPDPSTTKSTLRHPKEGSRFTHADRPDRESPQSGAYLPTGKVIELIDALIRDRAAGEEGGSWKVREAIEAANPADFEVIWKKLRELKPDPLFYPHITAIHRLGAREDIVAAGRLARSLLLPDAPPGSESEMMAVLASMSDPSITSALQFLREIDSPEAREGAARSIDSPLITTGHLQALQDTKARLDEWETRIILSRIDQEGRDPFASSPPYEEQLTAFHRTMDIVTLLEEQGVLSKGAREMLIIQAGGKHPDLFLNHVPAHERWEYFQKEGGDELVSTMIRFQYYGSSTSLKAVAMGEIPGYFFTPTGTRNLPPERIGVAVATWHMMDEPAAEAWLAENGPRLPTSQHDQACLEIADRKHINADRDTREWVDRIIDPVLREKTLDHYKLRD